MHNLRNCALFTLKDSFLNRSQAPRIATASKYLMDSIVSTDTPISRRGLAKSGFRPYVTPATIPATYPQKIFLFSITVFTTTAAPRFPKERQLYESEKNYLQMNVTSASTSSLAKDICSPVERFFTLTLPAAASSPPLMETNGIPFFSA